MVRLSKSVVTAVVLAVVATIGDVPSAAAQDRGWEFVVAPYFLFPYMSGSVSVKGFDQEIDAGPGDIFDKLNFGAMLALEAHSPDWAIALDGIYMGLDQDLPNVEGEVDFEQGVVQLSGFRRVAPWAEVLIGGRLNTLGGSLYRVGIVLPDTLDLGESKVWFDPFVGARLRVPGTDERLRVGVRGDVGGFGIGSTLAWQIYPLIGYRFARWFELAAAYRWLSMDYETGTDAERFAYDVTTFGPEIGLIFHF
jgi:hypothetical protein